MSNHLRSITTRGNAVPGWTGRPYDVHVPPGYRASKATPVVIVLHGGGGNSAAMSALTSPSGNPESSRSLNGAADKKGFIVVYPNGTPGRDVPEARTWNAGGGDLGFECVSGRACTERVDDVKYFKDLLATLRRNYNIDPKRVFVAGMSNGAALAYRLAQQAEGEIAAVAAIAGADQFSAVRVNPARRQVPILHIHGTADPVWPYAGGRGSAAGGSMVAPTKTIEEWIARNSAGPAARASDLPDRDRNDGTTTRRLRYRGGENGADVELYTVTGGGHTWPGGSQYRPASAIGRTAKDFSANEVVLDFFQQHPKRR